MPLQTILSAQGPLPLTATFTPIADGPVVLTVTGTAWSTTAPNTIGIEVVFNGVVIGTATLFANQNAVHMTLPTLLSNATIPSNQPQKVAIIGLAGTVTDFNDNFSVQLLL
jgi:hypothetical protein